MTVKEARPRFRVLLGVMLALDVLALVLLLTPLAGRRSDREAESARVQHELGEEIRKAADLRNVDEKIAQAERDVAAFYQNRLPARDSAIPDELGKIAAASGVRLGGVRYTADDEIAQGLRRVAIDASLGGDYVKVVKFINALERDKTFFIVDQVNLAEQQGGTVRLELKLEAFLKRGA